MTSIEISKKGNAVGFTVKGETVTGRYMSKSRAWVVTVASGLSLIDQRTRRFATISEAKEYAATLIDEQKTEELAWW